jgi:serine protease AprX
MSIRSGCLGVALAAFAAFTSITVPQLPAARQKLDRALTERLAVRHQGPVRVIVRGQSGTGFLADAINAHHGVIESAYTSPHSVTATVPTEQLRALANDRRVAGLSLDAPVRSMSDNDDDGARFSALLLDTMAMPATSLPVGDGVGIAIIDSGFEPATLSDFETRGSKFFDFTTGSANPKASKPYDNYGHGTHVAGLISSDGNGSDGLYRGMASGARLIHLKALDENGEGFTSTVVAALKFAVANKAALRIDILNLSLGHPIYEPAATDPLVQAVEEAVRAGIVVVVSAGNNGGDPTTHAVGYAGINSPGNAPSAITVGALDMAGTPARNDDTIPWYSSRGPTWYDAYQKPDLVAPGHHMVSDIDRTSTLYRSYPQYVVSAPREPKKANYFRLSGTSMSTATVTGAAALMIHASRARFGQALPPNAIKAVLEYTALPLANEDVLTQGAGALNVMGALTLAVSLDPAAAEGAWWLQEGVTPITTIAGTDLAWAQRVIWGNEILGADEIYSNWPAWAQRVVWGNRVIWGYRVIWGNSTVWSDASRLVWGDRIVWGNGLIGYVDGTRVIWGNAAALANVEASRIVWGNVSQTTLAALSTDVDPYGVDTLNRSEPSDVRERRHTRHEHRRVMKQTARDRLNARGDR